MAAKCEVAVDNFMNIRLEAKMMHCEEWLSFFLCLVYLVFLLGVVQSGRSFHAAS